MYEECTDMNLYSISVTTYVASSTTDLNTADLINISTDGSVVLSFENMDNNFLYCALCRRHASLPVETSSSTISPLCRRTFPCRQWKSTSFRSVHLLLFSLSSHVVSWGAMLYRVKHLETLHSGRSVIHNNKFKSEMLLDVLAWEGPRLPSLIDYRSMVTFLTAFLCTFYFSSNGIWHCAE